LGQGKFTIMNHPLHNALDALRQAKAINLPEIADVLKAPNGIRWHGRKRDGDQWMLLKHGIDSYQVQC